MSRDHTSDGNWTIREVKVGQRRPVTMDTVRALARDKDVRDVARVALKYAKPTKT